MCLATSKTAEMSIDENVPERQRKTEATFKNLIRPGMEASFYADWGNWFVLENTVLDEKTPGKLKGCY